MKTHVSPDAVTAYIRLSRDDVKQPGSLESKFANRREIVQRLAAQHGLLLPPAAIVCEQGSGTSLQARPGLLALLERCKRGEISHIITPYPDRLTRGGDHDRGTIKEALCLGNVTLISTEGVMKFDRDFGIRDELLFDLKAAVGAHYVRDVIHKRKEADLTRLKQGQGHKTSAPYGFYRVTKADVLEGKYPPDRLGQYHTIDAEYPILLEIFERLETEKVPAIALDLTRRGIPPPSATRAGTTGTRWHAGTLYALVRNPFYIGLLAQRSRVERGVGKKRLSPDAYILSDVKGDWEQPLSDEQFHTFSASILSSPRAVSKTGLLTGLLHCPAGRPMRSINQSLYGCDCKARGSAHAGCSVNAPKIEAWCQQAITEFVDALPPDAFPHTPSARRETGRAKVDLAQARQQLGAKDSQAQDLILREGYFVELMGRETYEDTARRVRLERRQLAARVEDLAKAASLPDLSQVASVVEQMRIVPIWEVLSGQAQREAVVVFLHRIDLRPPPQRYITSARLVWHDWTDAYAPQAPPFPAHPGGPNNLRRYLQDKHNRAQE